MSAATARQDRLLELLCDRALGQLDDIDAVELEELLRTEEPGDPEAIDRLVAELCAEGTISEPMPDGLRQRLVEDAARFHTQVGPLGSASDDEVIRSTAAGVVVPLRRRIPGLVPWLAAAASLGWLAWDAVRTSDSAAPGPVVERPGASLADAREAPPGPTIADPVGARRALLAGDAASVSLGWSSGGDPTAVDYVDGDVVWSDAEQAGFMRFVGLEPNDPAVSQYQLWIFDAERDERFPVDGGVFDVASSGEVVVPIDARLPVGRATAFAITVERAGGVVVSTRERVALIAAVEG